MNCIYIIKLDNKVVYIGRTNNPTARWNFHKTYETNELLKYYFSKYELKRFSFEIIKDNLSLDEAKKLETQLIKKYSSKYMLANDDIGDKKSLLAKEKISNALKHFWNSSKSDSLREKVKKPSHIRKVYDINTKLFFNSITDAARHFHVSRNTIYSYIKKGSMLYT